MSAPKGNQYALGNKGGRPKVPIDLEQADKLGQIHCTFEECAAVLGCSVRTLKQREDFLEFYRRGIESGKASLRRQQRKLADEGNATMLIWLGKQYLDQRDKRDDNVNSNVSINVTKDDIKTC